jgi:meiotically up-regulated gene 157 (Mug157) protein
MWLRDSSAQVWPYLPLAKGDANLRRMIEGLIRRQSASILIDPYANAFMPDPHSKPLAWAVHDRTDMKPGVGERKWEIDSLCYPIRLAHGYWKNTGDTAPFDEQWKEAARATVATFREQQRKNGPGPYRFQRASFTPTETQFLGGYGNPTRPNGMIHSMFRPSDDACLYPLFVPANLFAVASLKNLAELAAEVGKDIALAKDCQMLANEVSEALGQHGRIVTKAHGEIWAYEVDGFGNQLFMDDANAPSLLSLPYLGCCDVRDPLYQRTRARVWSTDNPYFFQGTAAEGIGGPHEGLGMIWPMSILIRALTSTDDSEIRQCLRWIKTTDAGTGFIHESFNKNDPKHFTRAWFAWSNTLFGELILRLSEQKPHLLSEESQ